MGAIEKFLSKAWSYTVCSQVNLQWHTRVEREQGGDCSPSIFQSMIEIDNHGLSIRRTAASSSLIDDQIFSSESDPDLDHFGKFLKC